MHSSGQTPFGALMVEVRYSVVTSWGPTVLTVVDGFITRAHPDIQWSVGMSMLEFRREAARKNWCITELQS